MVSTKHTKKRGKNLKKGNDNKRNDKNRKPKNKNAATQMRYIVYTKLVILLTQKANNIFSVDPEWHASRAAASRQILLGVGYKSRLKWNVE